MKEKEIRYRLIEHGQTLFRAPRQLIQFTKVPEADAFLNDLINNPHAFVLACVMDRQIKAEKAWLIPYRLSEKLHGFSMAVLSPLSQVDINRLMKQPEPLHRFIDKMSHVFHSGVQRIARVYSGDASLIWMGKPSSAEVVYRFLEFDGVGPKIGSMAANILAREFKIPFADYFSIDISADVHVRRAFSRMGLCAKNATVEQVIYKARALYPEFPGILDFPCWEIGRNWCKARGPECAACYMRDLCPTANDGHDSHLENKGKSMITGTVVSQGKDADDKDTCEVYISAASSDRLPHEYGQKKHIDIIIGNILYEAGVHETQKGVVWISSVLTTKHGGIKAKLVDALAEIGIEKGAKVRITRNEDDTYVLQE